MIVVTTSAFKNYNLKLKEFNRIPEPGELLDISKERYDFLHGGNKYNAIFVTAYVSLDNTENKCEQQKVDSCIQEVPEVIVINPKKKKKKKESDAEN